MAVAIGDLAIGNLRYEGTAAGRPEGRLAARPPAGSFRYRFEAVLWGGHTDARRPFLPWLGR
jgi:hypothetical protein